MKALMPVVLLLVAGIVLYMVFAKPKKATADVSSDGDFGWQLTMGSA